MPTKRPIQHGETVPLKLTAVERQLVLENLMCPDEDYEQVIRDTPSDTEARTLDEAIIVLERGIAERIENQGTDFD